MSASSLTSPPSSSRSTRGCDSCRPGRSAASTSFCAVSPALSDAARHSANSARLPCRVATSAVNRPISPDSCAISLDSSCVGSGAEPRGGLCLSCRASSSDAASAICQ